MLKDGANRSTPIMGKLANGAGGWRRSGRWGVVVVAAVVEEEQRGCLGTVCEGGVFGNARGEVGERDQR